MFPAAHSFFGVVTHTYLASTSSGLNVVATSRPNIGLKVATLRPMFRFGKVTHTYLASKSPGLNVAWPQRRLASMSPGLNVAWPQCRGLNVAGLNVAWPQCPIVFLTGPIFAAAFYCDVKPIQTLGCQMHFGNFWLWLNHSKDQFQNEVCGLFLALSSKLHKTLGSCNNHIIAKAWEPSLHPTFVSFNKIYWFVFLYLSKMIIFASNLKYR